MLLRVYRRQALPKGGLGPPSFDPTYIPQAFHLGFEDVHVLNTSGKKVERKTLAQLLKRKTRAVVYFDTQKYDPRVLPWLREGTLVFLVPLPPPPGEPRPGTPELPPTPPVADPAAGPAPQFPPANPFTPKGVVPPEDPIPAGIPSTPPAPAPGGAP
jgi:hypothetical protein